MDRGDKLVVQLAHCKNRKTMQIFINSTRVSLRSRDICPMGKMDPESDLSC